jgi:hypothetical protein
MGNAPVKKVFVSRSWISSFFLGLMFLVHPLQSFARHNSAQSRDQIDYSFTRESSLALMSIFGFQAAEGADGICSVHAPRPEGDEQLDGAGSEIRCMTSSGLSVVSLAGEKIFSHGTRFDRDRFSIWGGEVSKKMYEAFHQLAYQKESDEKAKLFSSAVTCGPGGDYCIQSYFLSESSDVDASGALVCDRSTSIMEGKAVEFEDFESDADFGEWLDRNIDRQYSEGNRKVDLQKCSFLGKPVDSVSSNVPRP